MSIDSTQGQPKADSPFATLVPQQYLLLTTFRKNGVAMPTPIWFAHEDGKSFLTEHLSEARRESVVGASEYQAVLYDCCQHRNSSMKKRHCLKQCLFFMLEYPSFASSRAILRKYCSCNMFLVSIVDKEVNYG